MPLTTQVTFTLKDALNTPVPGAVVTFQPNVNASEYLKTIDSILQDGDAVQVVSDQNGQGSAVLIASSQFQGGPLQYLVTIQMPDGNTRDVVNFILNTPMLITVPDSGPVDLTALL